MANVKDFGAVGDGTPTTPRRSSTPSSRGTARSIFPRGTYRLTRPLEVELRTVGPIALSGSGGTARLAHGRAGPGRPARRHARQVGRPDDLPRRRLAPRADADRLATVEIVGDHDQADGIELEGTMQATISGVLIRRCRYGVHLVKRNRNVLLADSHIYHGRAGGDRRLLRRREPAPDEHRRLPHQLLQARRDQGRAERDPQPPDHRLRHRVQLRRRPAPTRPTSGSTPARGPSARARSPRARSRPSAAPAGSNVRIEGPRARRLAGRGALDDHRQHPPEPAGQPAPPLTAGGSP